MQSKLQVNKFVHLKKKESSNFFLSFSSLWFSPAATSGCWSCDLCDAVLQSKTTSQFAAKMFSAKHFIEDREFIRNVKLCNPMEVQLVLGRQSYLAVDMNEVHQLFGLITVPCHFTLLISQGQLKDQTSTQVGTLHVSISIWTIKIQITRTDFI